MKGDSRVNQVTIVRVSDGVERIYQDESPWIPADEHGLGSVWWWTEGNGGCDCNRALFFARAAGEELETDPICGEERYRIPFITLPDGTRISVDDEFRPENAKAPSASSD